MARTKISEFSSTPANNTDIDSINIAEGCAPSNINDAIRELMAQLKDFQIGSQGDSFNGPIGTTTAAAGAFTTLSASSTVTLSGGTANGVTYLNGSKVLTSGSALTFDGTTFQTNKIYAPLAISIRSSTFPTNVNLHVSQDDSTAAIAKFTNTTTGVTATDGFDVGINASEQAYIWNNENTAMLFGVNNSEQMRLTSTGLGIGTSSPAYKLDVNISSGSVRIRSNTGTANSAGYLLGNSYRSWSILSESSAGNFIISDETTAGTPTRLTLDSAGNLGLGVTPSAWSAFKALEYVGGSLASASSTAINLFQNAYYNGSNYVYKNTNAASRYEQNTGAHNWFIASSGTAGNAISFTQAMTLTASGQLLVGTTSATAKAVVVGSGETVFQAAISGVAQINIGNGGNSINYYDADSQIFRSGNGTERARIDSSGNLLVGVTGGTSGQRIYASAANGTTAVIAAVNTTSGNAAGYTSLLQSAANNTSSFHYAGTTLGVANWYLYGNGTSSWSSDERLKKNITTTRDGYLEDVCKLRVVKYQWKNGPEQVELGLIAQEVEQVFPALVQDDLNPVSPDDSTIYKQLKGSVLPIILLKAIQEQQAIIESLKARLDAANL